MDNSKFLEGGDKCDLFFIMLHTTRTKIANNSVMWMSVESFGLLIHDFKDLRLGEEEKIWRQLIRQSGNSGNKLMMKMENSTLPKLTGKKIHRR